MARKRKYPWEEICTEYVTGDDSVTLRSLSHKYGCTLGMIGRMASKNGWTGQRDKYREQIRSKILEKTSSIEADIQSRQLKIARGMMSKALIALNELQPKDMTPQDIRLFITAASNLERSALSIDTQFGGSELDHDQRVEKIIELLRSRGITRD